MVPDQNLKQLARRFQADESPQNLQQYDLAKNRSHGLSCDDLRARLRGLIDQQRLPAALQDTAEKLKLLEGPEAAFPPLLTEHCGALSDEWLSLIKTP